MALSNADTLLYSSPRIPAIPYLVFEKGSALQNPMHPKERYACDRAHCKEWHNDMIEWTSLLRLLQSFISNILKMRFVMLRFPPDISFRKPGFPSHGPKSNSKIANHPANISNDPLPICFQMAYSSYLPRYFMPMYRCPSRSSAIICSSLLWRVSNRRARPIQAR